MFTVPYLSSSLYCWFQKKMHLTCLVLPRNKRSVNTYWMNGSAFGPSPPLSESYWFSSPSLPSLLIPSLLAPKILLLSYLDPQVIPPFSSWPPCPHPNLLHQGVFCPLLSIAVSLKAIGDLFLPKFEVFFPIILLCSMIWYCWSSAFLTPRYSFLSWSSQWSKKAIALTRKLMGSEMRHSGFESQLWHRMSCATLDKVLTSLSLSTLIFK